MTVNIHGFIDNFSNTHTHTKYVLNIRSDNMKFLNLLQYIFYGRIEKTTLKKRMNFHQQQMALAL